MQNMCKSMLPGERAEQRHPLSAENHTSLSHFQSCEWKNRSKPEVPSLGYMYPQGYICLSEGVHLRLAIEEKHIFTYLLFPNICTFISEYYFQNP